MFFGCFQIDIVDSHAGAADDFQVRSHLKNGSSDAGPAPDDQAIIVPNDVDQVFRRNSILIIGFCRSAQDGLSAFVQSI